MSINIQNNNQATIIVNDSNNINLNVVNNKNAYSYIEVNGGNNNNISIQNSYSENASNYLIFYIIIALAIVWLFISIFSSNKVKNNDLKTEETEENEENEFQLIKKEIVMLIDMKINSHNIKNRILSIINDFEETFEKNMSIMNNLKYNKSSMLKLKLENKNILDKMKDILDKIEIRNSSLEISNLDEILRYVNLVDNTNITDNLKYSEPEYATHKSKKNTINIYVDRWKTSNKKNLSNML